MTPRQLNAWAHFAINRKKREIAMAISSGALASRGDSKALDKRIKELTK